MGYCDSPAQFVRDRRVSGIDTGVAEGDACALRGVEVATSDSFKFLSRLQLQGLKSLFFASLMARLMQRPTKNEVAVHAQTNNTVNSPKNVAVDARGAAATSEYSPSAQNFIGICDNPNMHSASMQKRSAGTWLLLTFVHFYRVFFSPFLGGACKFHPSCSRYAQDAIALYGPRRGAWLAIKRLGRCRPFTKGGFDPVPEPEFPPGLRSGCDNSKFVTKALSYRVDYGPAGKVARTDEGVIAQDRTYRSLWYGDADWLRTASKGQAQ
jgi:uncharacterized protein